MAELVLHINNLSVALPAGADRPMALNNISLQLHAGQTLCVVGESGSGKSVLATTVMGLLDKELTVASGVVQLQGESLLDASQARLRALRGRAMGMVFQEPMTALNPVMRCGEQIDELLRTHTDWSSSQRRSAVLDMLAQVRLPDPERMWQSYPHQLSGGQRQRIGIARALYKEADVIVFDEATSALDNETEETLIQTIDSLRKDITILMIAHRLTTLRNCTQIIELGKNAQGQGGIMRTLTYAELTHSSPH
jgi:peptide/nickel transport system ATP-binding protein